MNAADQQAVQSIGSRRPSLWARELPFSCVLLLTILGVAYTSLTKQPIVGYWEILVPIIATMCIGTGWHAASDRPERWKLIWTQVLHWLAFLVVMNMVFLPSVQRMFTAGATGLTIFVLLTLGTFTAGVHVRSWQIGLLGLIMALGVPAIAWIENSALVAVLVVAGALGMAAVFGSRLRERAKSSAKHPVA